MRAYYACIALLFNVDILMVTLVSLFFFYLTDMQSNIVAYVF